MPSRCQNQPWVRHITPQELTAHMFSTSQMASGLQFLEAAFYANPGNQNEHLPYIGIRSSKGFDFNNIAAQTKTFELPEIRNEDFGSIAWGIGKSLAENEKGILLANPHFPHTGHLRFWQSHATIPGVLDVQGAALQGLPGIVNIGFNQNIAWSHTVSASDQFAVYQLSLDEVSPLTYKYDDETRAIDKKTFYVEVSSGNQSVVMAKDYYYSHYGPMVELPPEMGILGWSDTTAYSLKDAAEYNVDLIDHWLAINMSSNLAEFQQAFKDYNGIPWVNTVYADDQGNSFYIDKSRVLNLNDTALATLRSEPSFTAIKEQIGFYILPGNTSLFEPNGLNTYEKAPKLVRDDFVQNSNDSYWATNPEQPLSGYSLLYGQDFSPLSFRTRMSLKMLNELISGEEDGIDAENVEEALLSNRTYLAELVIEELKSQCDQQGNTLVELTSMSVDITEGCGAIAEFDGVMDKDAKGAHVFREFAFRINQETDFQIPFDASKPATTPNTLSSSSEVLKKFANAQASLQAANIPLNAELGDIQFTEKTLSTGSPSGERFSWAGAHSVEGGFNVYNTNLTDDTMYPMHLYSPVLDVESNEPVDSLMSDQGYLINSGSSWMFVVSFTEDGPEANGMITYSQSTDESSTHFDDQNRLYSETSGLRKILFKEEDVSGNTVRDITISN